MTPLDAVVLAGGSARRLGGADKPALRVGDRALLDRVLSALAGAGTVVVVGPQRPVSRPVVWAREDPPGGGPAAALAAGLPYVRAELVGLFAADLPFLTAETVAALTAALDPGRDGAVLLDGSGREQVLVGVWRTAALRAAVGAAGPLAGRGLTGLLQPLTRTVLPDQGGGPPPWWDCDTAAELAAARRWA